MRSFYLFTLTLLLSNFFLPLEKANAQIWDQKSITFPVPSQGWRIRPIGDNVAWTFGYGITPSPEGWGYSDSENSCQRTNDGGNTWGTKFFRFDGGGEGYILDVIGANDSVAFVNYYDYNQGTILYRTTDGGTTWSSNNGGADYFLNWVYFYDSNHGISFGDAGDNGFFQFSSTNDGGETWEINDSAFIQVVDPQEFGISATFAVKGDDIWTMTGFGRIIYSNDKGANWNVTDGPVTNFATWGIAADDNHNLYAIFNDDDNYEIHVWKKGSTDWVNITPQTNEGTIVGFSAIPGTPTLIFNSPTIWEDVSTYKTWVSHDFGTSWSVISSGDGMKFGFIEFSNPQTGYACEIPQSYESSSDNIFKYNGSPLTGLFTQNALPIELQVYPNPFLDEVRVKFDANKNSNYILLVNDIRGNLVFKKIYRENVSIHDVLNFGTLPKGCYTITLSCHEGMTRQVICK